MKIQVWDNGKEHIDQYTVILGHDVYGMSDDANMPNGFCQYIGDTKNTVANFLYKAHIVPKKKLPEGVRKQMAYIIRQNRLIIREWQKCIKESEQFAEEFIKEQKNG